VVAGTGGVLASTDRLLSDLLVDAEDAIRKLPVIGSLGVTVVGVPSDAKVRVPRKTKGGTFGWIARDGSLSSVDDLEFDDLTAEAHTAAVGAKLNRSSLIYTNPAMQEIVRRDLAVAVEDGINTAYLLGTGASDQPTGIVPALITAGQNFNGVINSGVSKAKYLQFTELVQDYDEAAASRKWLMHQNSINVAMTTVAFSGATVPITDTSSSLVGFPVVQSHRAIRQTSSLNEFAIFGDFTDTFMFQFGPAMDMMVNPYSDDVFMAGGVLVRGLLDLDFLIRDPKKLALALDVQS
jgi:HK97 family phage major capsid protein